jgi:hypothetical protein
MLAKALVVTLRLIHKMRNSPKIGKQSLKRLERQGSLSHVDITEDNIKAFDPFARKYGVGYALKKDSTTDPPTWHVLFNCSKEDNMTLAFEEFSRKILGIENDKKPSVRGAIRDFNNSKTEVNIAPKSIDVDKNAIRVKLKSKSTGTPEL